MKLNELAYQVQDIYGKASPIERAYFEMYITNFVDSRERIRELYVPPFDKAIMEVAMTLRDLNWRADKWLLIEEAEVDFESALGFWRGYNTFTPSVLDQLDPIGDALGCMTVKVQTGRCGGVCVYVDFEGVERDLHEIEGSYDILSQLGAMEMDVVDNNILKIIWD